jgi:hypothetical protein
MIHRIKTIYFFLIMDVNLNLGQLPCAQNIDYPQFFFCGIWISWKFHNDEQIPLNILLHNY